MSPADRAQLRALAVAARPGCPTFSPDVVLSLLDALDATERTENVDESSVSSPGKTLSQLAQSVKKAYIALPKDARGRRRSHVTVGWLIDFEQADVSHDSVEGLGYMQNRGAT